MKRRLVILATLLAAVVLAYGVSHWLFSRGVRNDPPPDDPLAWMQTGLQVDDATLAKVKALHASYQPICGGLCMEIAKANDRVRALQKTSRSMTPELAEAIKEAHRRQADCRIAMQQHIYETAALLPPDAAQRYLDIVTARLVQEGMCLADVTEKRP
jgi:hypothetical protein